MCDLFDVVEVCGLVIWWNVVDVVLYDLDGDYLLVSWIE